ncbi:MAG: FAD-dependent monooxygenase [Parvibaculaceae bacterium]
MPQKAHSADVVVVGAGLVGLTMALALGGRQARPPLDVVLMDNADPSQDRSTFDSRASAVTLSSRRLLEVLGVWDRLDAHAQPIRRIVVTDSRLGEAERPALLRFGETESGQGPSAFMIENRHLHAALREAVRETSGIRVIDGATVGAYAFGEAAAEIGWEDETLRASLLVAAEGRKSPARETAGIGTVDWAYGQSAIVTTVAHARPHEGTAEEHFLPAGPFAILPLKGNRSSLVWTEPTDEAERIMRLDEEGFRQELERRFGDHLGAVEPEGPRHSHPLTLQIAQRFVGPRLALIGDAAHVVHPIAGLGFNLGLRDVAALAECVADAARLGLDIGAAAVLERYEAWRRPDTVMVAAATDGLNRLFSNDNRIVRLMRDAGLGLVNGIGPLKEAFASEAAGLTGTLPRLLQGEAA